MTKTHSLASFTQYIWKQVCCWRWNSYFCAFFHIAEVCALVFDQTACLASCLHILRLILCPLQYVYSLCFQLSIQHFAQSTEGNSWCRLSKQSIKERAWEVSNIEVKSVDFGVFVNTLRRFMAREVIFPLGCRPVAGGRNLQDSPCLEHFTWMQWLETSRVVSPGVNITCVPFSSEKGKRS